MQHLGAARLAKRLRTEVKKEEEHPPKEIPTASEGQEQQSVESASDPDSGPDSKDSEGKENCEIIDSEEQDPVQATTPALETLIASSQKEA